MEPPVTLHYIFGTRDAPVKYYKTLDVALHRASAAPQTPTNVLLLYVFATRSVRQTVEEEFNEYMTWAVFSLYCIDNFAPEDALAIIEHMEKNMVHGRGFIRFPEFNRKLMELYRNTPDAKIAELYPHMLSWCEVN